MMAIALTAGRWLIGTTLGQVLLAGLGAFIVHSAWLYAHDKQVVASHIAQSVKEGQRRNEINDPIKRDARKPGSFERLRADPKTCGDCR